jgi:hypothetical protein
MKIKLPRFMRQPPMFSHRQALERLKNVGFAPSTIYDIGAFHGDWTKDARQVFPSAKYFLFEANADNKPALDATGEKYFMAVMSRHGDRRFALSRKDRALFRRSRADRAGDDAKA